MATIYVQTLVNQVRIESDLGTNQVCTDPDIASMLSDAGSDLYDIFTQANQHYAVSTFSFSLVGGVNGNSVSLPADFQQGHGVDVNPGTANPYSLKYMSNWLDRNSVSSPYAFFLPGSGPREYVFLDSKLYVYPAASAAGSYLLYYTPLWTPWQVPQGAPADSSGNSPLTFAVLTGGQYQFTNTNWTAQNVGDTVTFSGFGSGANNGTFTITSVPSTTAIITSNASSANESNTGATVVDQPAGTSATVPTTMNPWIRYIKNEACITIRSKRDLPVEDFMARRESEKARIQAILQERQEEPTQPPLTRGRGGFWDAF